MFEDLVVITVSETDLEIDRVVSVHSMTGNLGSEPRIYNSIDIYLDFT